MYPVALEHLTDPRQPDSSLVLEPGAIYADDGGIMSAWLRSAATKARYRITDGIPDLLGFWALPTTPAQVTNYLPPTAWAYERVWRPRSLSLLTGERFGYRRELPLITELSAPQRGGLYVDVACSNGLYARALEAQRGGDDGHIVGIDHSLPMLRQARAFAQQEGLQISYVRARAQALPFASSSAAGVVMGGSLNEIGDAPAALREVARVLSPQGRCMMMSIVQATTAPGRVLQRVLGTGGIDFLALDDLNQQFTTNGLHLRAQWVYRVVAFSLLTKRMVG